MQAGGWFLSDSAEVCVYMDMHYSYPKDYHLIFSLHIIYLMFRILFEDEFEHGPPLFTFNPGIQPL